MKMVLIEHSSHLENRVIASAEWKVMSSPLQMDVCINNELSSNEKGVTRTPSMASMMTILKFCCQCYRLNG